MKDNHDHHQDDGCSSLNREIREFREQSERRDKHMDAILHRMEHKLDKIMTALETLTDAVSRNTSGQAELTTAVNAAVIRIGTPGATDAQLLTVSALVDTNTANAAALTVAINDALNPTPAKA